MHVVENALSEAEQTVVRNQVVDQIERKFAESGQVATVSVSFETQAGASRRLLSARTSIRTVIAADNTLGGKQPVYTTESIDNALTGILTALRVNVISSTTSVKLQEPATGNGDTGTDAVLIAAAVAIVVSLLACVMCVVYVRGIRS